MSLLKIIQYPDDPLTRQAVPVAESEFGEGLVRLANDMLETMEHNDGVGLAAPQIGLSKRLLVLCEPEGEPICLANPSIEHMEGREYGEEGCLSLPKLYARISRATRIQVRARDVFGNELNFEACGFLARIIQHEFDHLEGLVFPDRLDVFSREDALRQWEQLRQENSAGSAQKAL